MPWGPDPLCIYDTTFDSELYHPSSRIQVSMAGRRELYTDLWIKLRLYLEQMNPPGGAHDGKVPDSKGTERHIVRWDGAAWATFTSSFHDTVERFWDRAFWLAPPADYHDMDMEGQTPKVWCRLDLQLLSAPGNEHVRLAAVRLGDDELVFGSDIQTLDTRDLISEVRSSATTQWRYIAALHEVGHLLGLQHVNQMLTECQADPNMKICYGMPGSRAERTLMGRGMELTQLEAEPWRRRAAQHTATGSYLNWAAFVATPSGV